MSSGKHEPVKPQDIESLIELFKRSDWDEMHVQVGEFELFLSNDPSARGPDRQPVVNATVPAVMPPAEGVASMASAHTPPAAVVIPDGMVAIRAPNLGTFYRAPKPGASAYVELGQRIDQDTEVCLIEVMKLFAPVRAGLAGTVREIRATDGQMVEYNDVLFIVDPAG